jgi:hypothetical protein
MSNTMPRPEYPRPQFRRPTWMNLNGTWEYQTDRPCSGEGRGYGVNVNADFTEQIIVPFCRESVLSGIPALIRHEYDDGDLLLYAFSPIFRCQQDSTYKLLANALFLRCERKFGNKTIHYRHHLEIPTVSVVRLGT